MVNKNPLILDCTLRDGGYVNNFSFGEQNILKIVKNLNASNVDFIELGFLKNGDHCPNQTLFNYVNEVEKFIPSSSKSNYSLMIRPDWYDINFLKKSDIIKNIRFAFHLKDIDLTIYQANVAREKGYEVVFNPVNVLSYSDFELENILLKLKDFDPLAIYMVDTFGSMTFKDLEKIFHIFINNINSNTGIGLHLHENLSLSLGLAIKFLQKANKYKNKFFIDSSVLGIGRIPGNLCTELILNYLNQNEMTDYFLDPIYDLINSPISEIKKQNDWGYMPAYALTGFYKIHRSYAEFLLNKSNLSLSSINKIFLEIKESDKSNVFDEAYLQSLLKKTNESF